MTIEPVTEIEPNDAALESRARRIAKRNDCIIRKSRWRAGSIDNLGGFQIVDAYRNYIVAGARYELSAQDVIDWFEG